MRDNDEIVGHKTFRNPDGTMRHEPLHRSEADAIWADIERKDTARRKAMPTETDAINAFFEAWLRLKDFGWRDAIYCPKDGRAFDAIEAGSTGIHSCNYQGEWPDGRWWIMDNGDQWPSRPVLFRDKAAQAEREA